MFFEFRTKVLLGFDTVCLCSFRIATESKMLDVLVFELTGKHHHDDDDVTE